ncbi:UNVERIFIED_ORG: type III secretion regulatory protein HpaA [Paraburkholderia sediminicola]|nr:type III secretion regulatory protein HpaA [Paraburkholderia sediminicola]
MSIPRIGGGYTPPADLSSDAESVAQQQAALAVPHHRHGHALTRAKRPSLRKRRSAESPDANDPAAESEELLMMLDQHLRRSQTDVMRVDAREPRGNQHGFGQDEHSAGAEPNGKRTDSDDTHDLPARALPMRFAQRTARDETALLKHSRAVSQGSARSPGDQAEAALIGVQTAARKQEPSVGGKAPARASPTYAVLAIVREFLQMPDGERTSRTTLAQIRDRLVSASTRAGRDMQNNPQSNIQTGVSGAAQRPLSAAEESMNLLLPIALLNLGRSRTRAGRAMGMSALAALIRRGRGW